MNGFSHHPRRRWWGMLALAVGATLAVAETARVELDDGTIMRGDVELTAEAVLIRNAAGVVRCPRERVARVEWLEPARTIESEYARRIYELDRDDVQGRLALAEWLIEKERLDLARAQCAEVLEIAPDNEDAELLLQRIAAAAGHSPQGAVADQPEGTVASSPPAEVSPPPSLSERDILKLKLSELELDGPPERLSVRFRRLRDKLDVEDLVRDEMAGTPDYDPSWAHTLESGQPYEKLPVVLKATGLKYADRIELNGNPRVFATYRRHVLPLVIKGCVRSGCHGGRTARAFRFPVGSQSSEEFVYTSFVILDEIETAGGPMIDRALPGESILLRYLLPVEEGRETHPPVQGERIKPVLRGTRDHRYEAVTGWIGMLRSPHPDYALEYEFPSWLERLSRQRRRDSAPARDAAAEAAQQAEDQPDQPPPDDQDNPDQPGDGDRP